MGCPLQRHDARTDVSFTQVWPQVQDCGLSVGSCSARAVGLLTIQTARMRVLLLRPLTAVFHDPRLEGDLVHNTDRQESRLNASLSNRAPAPENKGHNSL